MNENTNSITLQTSTPKDSSSTTSGAMALLEKYAKLNKAIESTREEISRSRSDLTSIQSQTIALNDEEKSFIEQTNQARSESEPLQDELKELTNQISDREREQVHAIHLKNEAQREWNLMKKLLDDDRRNFIESSQSFRTSVKRLRFEISSLPPMPGSEPQKDHSTHGYPRIPCFEDELSPIISIDDGDDSTEEKNNESNDSKENKKHRMDDASPDTISKAYPNDTEIMQAAKEEKDVAQIKDKMIQTLEEMRRKKEAAEQRFKERKTNMENQHCQLKRIKRDIDEMSRELAAVERDTIEKTKSKATQQNKSSSYHGNRRMNTTNSRHGSSNISNVSNTSNHVSTISNNPSQKTPQKRVVHNPYKKKIGSNNKTSYTDEDSNNKTNTGSPSINNGPYQYTTTSQLAKQYPHRAGRIRVDKQFTTALSITAQHDDEDEQASLDTNNSTKEIHEAKKSNKGLQVNVSSSGSSTSSSDDDDDKLLSFVPFKKK